MGSIIIGSVRDRNILHISVSRERRTRNFSKLLIRVTCVHDRKKTHQEQENGEKKQNTRLKAKRR